MEIDTNAICDGGGAGHDYRQFGVLREFGNIANGVSDEEFLNIMRQTAKLNRVKWQPTLKCLRERIQESIEQDWSTMWSEENMTDKLDSLEKQKEKFSDASRPEPIWRPQLTDAKAQLKGNDVAILQKKMRILELEVMDYESRVDKLKKSLVPKRGYLKAMQVEIHKYQKKNNELCKAMDELFEKHSQVAEKMCLSSKENIEMEFGDAECLRI